jgi:F-type H+-transporting ATPase subunit c
MKELKILWLVLTAVVVVLASTTPLFAAPGDLPTSVSYLLSGSGAGAGIGAGIVMLGAGYGFSRIGSAALESMARQPEVAGRVGTNMIVIAALLEGATFFALLVCLLITLLHSGV